MKRLLVASLLTTTSLLLAFYRMAYRPFVLHPPFDLEAEVASWWAVDVVDA